MKKLSVLAIILILSSAVCAQYYDEVANVNFLVLKDDNGKPVRNAGVVMHPVNKNGKQSRGGLELKTDAEGKASYNAVPYGKMRVQVLAPGFQTYGEDYDVKQPNLEITVKLKRPAGQYSIYEDHPTNKDKDKGDSKDKPADPDAKPPQ